MEKFEDGDDVYVAGRRQVRVTVSGGDPEEAPEPAEDDDDQDDDGEETVSVHRTGGNGPVVVQQDIRAGRNAFGVAGDATIIVRNRD